MLLQAVDEAAVRVEIVAVVDAMLLLAMMT